jgi:hypothetical protein
MHFWYCQKYGMALYSQSETSKQPRSGQMTVATEKHFAIIDAERRIVSTCFTELDAIKFMKTRRNFGSVDEVYVQAWLTFENGAWRFATEDEIATKMDLRPWWQQATKPTEPTDSRALLAKMHKHTKPEDPRTMDQLEAVYSGIAAPVGMIREARAIALIWEDRLDDNDTAEQIEIRLEERYPEASDETIRYVIEAVTR